MCVRVIICISKDLIYLFFNKYFKKNFYIDIMYKFQEYIYNMIMLLVVMIDRIY